MNFPTFKVSIRALEAAVLDGYLVRPGIYSGHKFYAASFAQQGTLVRGQPRYKIEISDQGSPYSTPDDVIVLDCTHLLRSFAFMIETHD